jgi:hypothetical protein
MAFGKRLRFLEQLALKSGIGISQPKLVHYGTTVLVVVVFRHLLFWERFSREIKLHDELNISLYFLEAEQEEVADGTVESKLQYIINFAGGVVFQAIENSPINFIKAEQKRPLFVIQRRYCIQRVDFLRGQNGQSCHVPLCPCWGWFLMAR